MAKKPSHPKPPTQTYTFDKGFDTTIPAQWAGFFTPKPPRSTLQDAELQFVLAMFKQNYPDVSVEVNYETKGDFTEFRITDATHDIRHVISNTFMATATTTALYNELEKSLRDKPITNTLEKAEKAEEPKTEAERWAEEWSKNEKT